MFDMQYPLVPPVCNAVLPLPFQPNWSSTSSLVDIVNQFEKVFGEDIIFDSAYTFSPIIILGSFMLSKVLGNVR